MTLRLAAGDAVVELAPEIGGSIASYIKAGLPVLRPIMEDASLGARGQGSYPLVPFSNRIAYRRFTWDGRRHELPALLGGHAIHGVGWQAKWEVTASDATTATMALHHAAGPLWPFAFETTQSFWLLPDSLEITMAITNRHGAPAPVGFGLHPFFPRTPSMRLQFHASHVWHNDEPEKIPVYRSVPDPAWDHTNGLPVGQAMNQCYAGWDGHASLTYPEHDRRIDIDADPVFRHLILFVPEGQHFLGVEPVTNMNDGLNRMAGGVDHGVLVLAPGETATGRIRFSVKGLAP
jgi:aldose 1-epimerase